MRLGNFAVACGLAAVAAGSSAADLSPDQSKIAVGGPGRLIKIHATSDGAILQKIKKHTDWVTALAFSPNGEMPRPTPTSSRP